MTTWALIVFALGAKPELVETYKNEADCVKARDLIELIGGKEKAPECFVMVRKSGMNQDE